MYIYIYICESLGRRHSATGSAATHSAQRESTHLSVLRGDIIRHPGSGLALELLEVGAILFQYLDPIVEVLDLFAEGMYELYSGAIQCDGYFIECSMLNHVACVPPCLSR